MVSKGHKLSVRRQCALLTLARSNLYYQPKGESAENLQFMGIIDKQFLETPWYGSRQMARHMKRNNHQCGRHRVRRLMRLMRLVPIYQEPNTSKKHPQHKIWPYLLRNTVIDRPNQVWCADITYIPMRRGFLYLVAIMDWFSRKVLAWRLSNSMDGKGRWIDNRMIERLWRSLKYECIFLHAFEKGSQAKAGIAKWLAYYNVERPHSTHGIWTPNEVYDSKTEPMRLAA